MIITDTTQCWKRPASGALNGLLLAQKRDHGRMPSRPSSCTRRPWEKMTESTLPKADRATNTLSARSALGPNTLRKKDAARIRPLVAISSRETAAK